jgi:hypothetical protein
MKHFKEKSLCIRRLEVTIIIVRYSAHLNFLILQRLIALSDIPIRRHGWESLLLRRSRRSHVVWLLLWDIIHIDSGLSSSPAAAIAATATFSA